MSVLVESFSRLLAADRHRPLIHVPATHHSLSRLDLWNAATSLADALDDALARRAGPFGPAGKNDRRAGPFGPAGSLVVIAAGNRPLSIAAVLATRMKGAALLAVDSGATATELRDICQQFDAAAVIAPVDLAPALGDFAAPLDEGIVLVTHPRRGSIDYTGTALLKLTSGSTGVPKAARWTEAQLVADSSHIIEGMRISPDDTQLGVIPLSHAYGFSVVLMPLLLQGTPVVLRDSFVPHQLTADAESYGVRMFAGVPFMFDYFLTNPPGGGWPSSIGKLVSAGAPLQPSTVRGFLETFGVKIHSFYGTSESGGISYDDSDDLSGAGTVGRPLPGVTVTLRAEDGGARVHIAGDAVGEGYVHAGEPGFDGEGFLTGDYGTIDADGRLRLTGRVSSFINVAGKKVQPEEVEDVLRTMPGIRDVRVLAASDPQRGEQVAACLVAVPGEPRPSMLAVRRHCCARLAAFKIPRVVVVLDAFPMTARGKVDRRALDEAVKAAMAGIPEQLC